MRRPHERLQIVDEAQLAARAGCAGGFHVPILRRDRRAARLRQ